MLPLPRADGIHRGCQTSDVAAAELSIRVAEPDDAGDLARVHIAAWRAAYRGIVPDEHLDALSWSDRRDRWSDLLTDPGNPGRTIIAVLNSQLVGFASTGPCRDEDLAGQGVYELFAIYLDPSHWRRGTGSALLRAALSGVPAGTPAVTLWVLEANTAARSFYARHGFTPDGASKPYLVAGTTVPEVRYRRMLGEPSTAA